MTAAAQLAAELRAQWPGSWIIKGIDRAAHFGDDLARRGVATLAGAMLRQVGMVPGLPTTVYQHDDAIEVPGAPVPAFVVEFSGGLKLGYGNGFKAYSTPTLNPFAGNMLARTTEGTGAVQLRVADLGGGRAGFVPQWQATSDKDDAIAIVAGVAAVVTAGLTYGAYAGGVVAAEVAAPSVAGYLGELSIVAPMGAVDIAAAGASGTAAWGAAGAELGAGLFAELAPGLAVAGGTAAAASAGASSGASSLLAKLEQSITGAITKAGGSALTSQLVSMLTGGGTGEAAKPAAQDIGQPSGAGPLLALAALAAAAVWAFA